MAKRRQEIIEYMAVDNIQHRSKAVATAVWAAIICFNISVILGVLVLVDGDKYHQFAFFVFGLLWVRFLIVVLGLSFVLRPSSQPAKREIRIARWRWLGSSILLTLITILVGYLRS